jgi:hypothetical protein
MYSRRLLQPYVGVIQVADMDRARALSVDGENWAIRYALADNAQMQDMPPSGDPRINYSPVATVEQGRLKTHAVHTILDPGEVRSAIHQLYEALTTVEVPFEAADHYEYWLLDDRDGSPLALLHSALEAREMQQPPPYPTWLAMPAVQLEIQEPERIQTQINYMPPINHRLQLQVEERAGYKPHGAWFKRPDPAADDFPPCLVREDWDDEQQQQVCERYIHRLAPRLLMMQGLSPSVRHRLEQCACEYVFDVERFYPLYPEVVDNSRLNAARVEARLRRANDT